MKNHAPISLLTVFNKILEKVRHNRLSPHLHINKTLLPEQFGFRKGISNKNAAYKLTVYHIS
jgi:Reverse transcriptase (RNA-dependent DNA polymerase).